MKTGQLGLGQFQETIPIPGGHLIGHEVPEESHRRGLVQATPHDLADGFLQRLAVPQPEWIRFSQGSPDGGIPRA